MWINQKGLRLHISQYELPHENLSDFFTKLNQINFQNSLGIDKRILFILHFMPFLAVRFLLLNQIKYKRNQFKLNLA